MEAMIEHFKENIEEVSPPQMTKAEIQDAENLMLTLQEQFKNGASKHLPRNEAAIREKMIQIMKKSKFVPYGQHAGDVDYEKDTVQIFQELIHAAKFGGDIPVVEAELKDWEKDKKTDAEVLLDIEVRVWPGNGVGVTVLRFYFTVCLPPCCRKKLRTGKLIPSCCTRVKPLRRALKCWKWALRTTGTTPKQRYPCPMPLNKSQTPWSQLPRKARRTHSITAVAS